MQTRGVVAAGHQITAQAAAEILEEGGNAYDAILAAALAATVAEPVLCSLGGGGFLLARPASGTPRVYDFFVQTPQQKAAEVDFHPILADFGTAQQEFHIGLGSCATPGVVRGLFRVHRDLGSLPMTRIAAPAVRAARHGVRLNRLQAYIFSIVAPIYTATPEAAGIYAGGHLDGGLVREGESLLQPQLADSLEALAREGEGLFYEGEMARAMLDLMANRGHLRTDDLRDYRVECRRPLQLDYRGARIYTNPPPSSGGILIAFALKLLETVPVAELGFGSAAYLRLLSEIMALTNRARLEAHVEETSPQSHPEWLLDAGLLARYREEVHGLAASLRGTTHISVLDGQGNAAAMTLSNGEGCGHLIPGTGIMLNNMLGEEDLNPHGFHQWPANTRMTSMMAPTLIEGEELGTVVTGSGGSNRIRSAILQLLVKLVDFRLGLEAAVDSPRVHREAGLTSIEGGFDAAAVEQARAALEPCAVWQERNLFFGGAHTVMQRGDKMAGAADPRRDGVTIKVS